MHIQRMNNQIPVTNNNKSMANSKPSFNAKIDIKFLNGVSEFSQKQSDTLQKIADNIKPEGIITAFVSNRKDSHNTLDIVIVSCLKGALNNWKFTPSRKNSAYAVISQHLNFIKKSENISPGIWSV